MPFISKFFGIIIRMYFGDHNPPHLHAVYGEYSAVFSIATGQMIDGDFPPKQTTLVTAWILIHQDELKINWELLGEGLAPNRIKELR